MTLAPNVDYLSSVPHATTWKYRLGDGPLAFEKHEETVIEILSELGGVLQEFVRPLEFRFTLFEYGEDPFYEREKTGDVVIGNDDSLAVEDLLTAIREQQGDPSTVSWISYVEFRDATVNVRLADGDRWIGKGGDHYLRTDSQSVEDAYPPLHIYLDIRPLPNQHLRYGQIVQTNTDIWYEDTEIGATNRARLARFLQDLDAALDPVETEIDGEEYNGNWLRRQGYEELLL